MVLVPAKGNTNDTLLNKIWRGLTSFLPLPGQQRPLSSFNGYLNGSDNFGLARQYDLEITEFPIRDANIARKLIEMIEYCPEVATCTDIIVSDVFSSEDGDDQGFAISQTLNDDVTPIDPAIYKILCDFIQRVVPGLALDPYCRRIIDYGDAFSAIGVNLEQMQIDRLLLLPTWEMFRVESNQGILSHFEQRRYLSDGNAIPFHPLQICHWRNRRKLLYGRSIWRESLQDWENLKAATQDLARLSRQIGVNPNIHVMPSNCDDDYRLRYKTAYEAKLASGMVTDFYLMCGADVKKVANFNPDLKASSDNVLAWRSRIVMRSRVPPYLIGLPSIGAREIAMQPSLAYARYINSIRMVLTEGISQMCNLELALKGIPKDRWKYRIVWPRIITNPFAPSDEANNIGITDLDG